MRPAVEAALALARRGGAELPPRRPPPALRPLLRFAKLPTQAVSAVVRLLDSDEDFRAQVAESTSEEEVGKASWLFLARPEGWEEELAVLLDVARSAHAADAEDRVTDEMRRRLADAEDELRRTRLRLESAEQGSAAAEAALAEERRARRARAEELEAARRSLSREEAAHRRAVERAMAAEALAETLRARVDEIGAPPPRPADLSAVRLLLEEAAAAASQLASRLSAAAGGLEDEEGTTVLTSPAGATAAADPAVPGGGTHDADPAPPPPRPEGRRPVRLPPGVLDDSVEAATHLVRQPRAALLVDGYNVSQRAWGDQSPAEQRRRLVDAMGELAARTGAEVRVVFDGSAEAVGGGPTAVPRAVKVSFSPPDVEADDVIVGMVAAFPPSRPVVVASSDNRVRDEADRAGANTISAGQLLAAAGRVDPRDQ